MNKRKKGFLTAASILTIVGSAFAIIIALFMFSVGSISNEQMIKEALIKSDEYVYYEDVDGSYYFIEIDEDTMQEVRLEEKEIELIAKVFSILLYVGGFFAIAFAIVRLILAIKVLINNNRQKYSLGLTITSLVFAALTAGTVETVLWVVSLCIKNKPDNMMEQITI